MRSLPLVAAWLWVAAAILVYGAQFSHLVPHVLLALGLK